MEDWRKRHSQKVAFSPTASLGGGVSTSQGLAAALQIPESPRRGRGLPSSLPRRPPHLVSKIIEGTPEFCALPKAPPRRTQSVADLRHMASQRREADPSVLQGMQPACGKLTIVRAPMLAASASAPRLAALPGSPSEGRVPQELQLPLRRGLPSLCCCVDFNDRADGEASPASYGLKGRVSPSQWIRAQKQPVTLGTDYVHRTHDPGRRPMH
mmetsp:Transcript_122933/g.393825  ORF Transcript_122933/g.393825 Transcript_122933/m.393825 type:complete len:212 (+) Transcript_122933:69-704(+)